MKATAFVLVPVLAAAGCKGGPPPAAPAASATVVQSSVALGDPHIVSDSVNRLNILFSIYEALVATDERGGYQPAHHCGYHPETPAYPHDPEKARRLLAEAGYGKGLALVVDIPSTMPDEAPALTRMMAEQYQQVVITVKVVEHGDRGAGRLTVGP